MEMTEDTLNGYPIILVKLYAIEEGWLGYLPQSIPAVRNVKEILDDIFQTRRTILIDGHQCLFKNDIRAGIHNRVLSIMGTTCVSCHADHKRNMNVHHIKPHWRAWNNSWGFTTLCQDCHKSLQVGLPIPTARIKELCSNVALPNSPLYDPPADTGPEPNIVKLPHWNYFYQSCCNNPTL
jgi:hypothetical protein